MDPEMEAEAIVAAEAERIVDNRLIQREQLRLQVERFDNAAGEAAEAINAFAARWNQWGTVLN